MLFTFFVCYLDKVYRTAFYQSTVGPWPERIRYEDQLPAARAYSGAKSFDVLQRVVYSWQIRDDGSSITQQKQNIKDLRDRSTVIRSVTDFFKELGNDALLQNWLAKAIAFDLRPYFEVYPLVDDEYRALLRETALALAPALDADAWKQTLPWDRLLLLSVVKGTAHDVSTLLAQRQEDGWEMLGTPHDGGIQLSFADADRLSFELEPGALDVAPAAVRSWAILDGYSAADGVVAVTGHAYFEHVDAEDFPLTIKVAARTEDSREVHARVERWSDPNIDDYSSASYTSRSAGRFRAEFDARELLSLGKRAQVELTLTCESLSATHGFSYRSRPGSAWNMPLDSHDVRVKAEFVPDTGLVLEPAAAKVLASEVSDADGVLTVTVPQAKSGGLFLEHEGEQLELKAVEAHPGRFALPSLRGAAEAKEWRLRLQKADGKSPVVQFAGSTAALAAGAGARAGAVARMTVNGALRFVVNPVTFTLSTVEVTDSVLILGGTLDEARESTFAPVLQNATGDRKIEPRELSVEGGKWRAEFALVDDASHLAVWAATYDLWASDGAGELWPPVWTPELKESMPRHAWTSLSRLRISRVPGPGTLRVEVLALTGQGERGRLARRRELTKLAASNAIVNETLFESFGGSSIGDSPLGLSRAASANGWGGKHFWAVAHHGVPVPEKATPVVVGSFEYLRLLNQAKWLVNNNNFPHYFRKREDQFYVQTWHGTPLKRIANDMLTVNVSFSYQELMLREAQAWDVLLAQNTYSEEIFPGAFGFDGPQWAVGYPRNDVLVTTQEQDVLRLREGLGIPAGARAVLYAPTWRDHEKTSGGYKLVSYLDVDELRALCGEDTIVLLRGHSNTLRGNDEALPEGVIDVSSHPVVNDLILASDVLVTDYSSIMFDYAVTGKPFYLLTPDIEEYGGSTRGFYVDPREIAPVEVALNTAELAAQLSRAMTEEERSRYAAFVSRFLPNDDGKASERVAQRIWGIDPSAQTEG